MKLWNVIDVLEQAFRLSQLLGLSKSKAEFSERLLDKGPSYLSSMSARDRCPSIDVLHTLESKLLALLAAHNGTTQYGMEYAPITTVFHARLLRVYEFVRAARRVHGAFADDFHPANDNVPPPHEHATRMVALSYSCPDWDLDMTQPKVLRAGQ